VLSYKSDLILGVDYMRIPKIYVETTLFNFYVDVDREAHADTVKLFNEIKAKKYEAFTSRYVVDELGNAEKSKREKMLSLILEYDIPILEPNDEAVKLADLYVVENVIPPKYRTDALHIAIAAVNDLDMIISMNFQHIVKRKTIKMTEHINVMNGYRVIEIYSPMEVVENETD
jgi:predicted nucleic acid-binding protein